MAQGLGYSTTFLILGSFALASIALWVGFAAVVKPACAGAPDTSTPDAGASGAPA